MFQWAATQGNVKRARVLANATESCSRGGVRKVVSAARGRSTRRPFPTMPSASGKPYECGPRTPSARPRLHAVHDGGCRAQLPQRNPQQPMALAATRGTVLFSNRPPQRRGAVRRECGGGRARPRLRLRRRGVIRLGPRRGARCATRGRVLFLGFSRNGYGNYDYDR